MDVLRRHCSVLLLNLFWSESFAMADERTVVQFSEGSFESTIERLRSVIVGAGMTIFAEIDHAAAALAVGLNMPPTIVMLYGNPKAGTPVMVAAPSAALELPLRVLISKEHDGRVSLSYQPIAPALESLGVAKDVAATLVGGQTLLQKALRT